MKYLGGKCRIGKHLAAAIAADTDRRVFWDAFCGGLGMTAALAAQGKVYSTDAHPALISLYEAVRGGWDPPDQLPEVMYRWAQTLPDENPLKAFAGFGCSFGGKYFGGYARGSPGRCYAAEARRSLLRDCPLSTYVGRVSFFDVSPRALRDVAIYCDPPYASTTGYSTGIFDSSKFWRYAQAWVACGVPVYVSEYGCPVPHRLLWEQTRSRGLRGNDGSKHTERLFRVIPEGG